TNILLVTTGRVISSPSEWLPAEATTRYVMACIPSGILISQLTVVLLPFAVVKGCCSRDCITPFCKGFIVRASNRESSAEPLRSLSDRFVTFEVKYILSFSLKNLG